MEAPPVAWSQYDECFALPGEKGFAIYNTEPLRELCRRNIGGVSLVAMMFRTNVLALVGGGRAPIDARNKVLIWDDAAQRITASLEMVVPVLAIAFRRDRLVVATMTSVFVYAFPSLELLNTLETSDNPFGLLAVCPAADCGLVAFPARQTGHVVIYDTSGKRALTDIPAHKHAVRALALSVTGHLLASASASGTLVRVYDTKSHTLLYTFRRGIMATAIHCLRFNHDASYLCASSDRTIHVFDCRLTHDARAAGVVALPASSQAAAVAAAALAASRPRRSPSPSPKPWPNRKRLCSLSRRQRNPRPLVAVARRSGAAHVENWPYRRRRRWRRGSAALQTHRCS
eukprot:m.127094 g.127094  ORF g.127094 m.127094 type:complete len:344 (-) comp16354_c1_seq1:1789-2820(-)